MNPHMVKRTLDRIDDSFRMFATGRISPFILAVNLRQHGASLGTEIPNAQVALEGLADEVDAEAAKTKDPKHAVAGMHERFKVWRKDVEAEAKAAGATAVRAADPALAAAAKEVEALGSPASAGAPAAPKAPVADEDDVAEMTMEEIEAILAQTRSKL